MVSHPHKLRCACQEVKDPVLGGWVHPEWAPAVYQLLGVVVLNAELKPANVSFL